MFSTATPTKTSYTMTTTINLPHHTEFSDPCGKLKHDASVLLWEMSVLSMHTLTKMKSRCLRECWDFEQWQAQPSGCLQLAERGGLTAAGDQRQVYSKRKKQVMSPSFRLFHPFLSIKRNRHCCSACPLDVTTRQYTGTHPILRPDLLHKNASAADIVTIEQAALILQDGPAHFDNLMEIRFYTDANFTLSRRRLGWSTPCRHRCAFIISHHSLQARDPA